MDGETVLLQNCVHGVCKVFKRVQESAIEIEEYR
jgi:hypothetical protein